MGSWLLRRSLTKLIVILRNRLTYCKKARTLPKNNLGESHWNTILRHPFAWFGNIKCRYFSRPFTDLDFFKDLNRYPTFIFPLPLPHQSMLRHFDKLLKVIVLNIAPWIGGDNLSKIVAHYSSVNTLGPTCWKCTSNAHKTIFCVDHILCGQKRNRHHITIPDQYLT